MNQFGPPPRIDRFPIGPRVRPAAPALPPVQGRNRFDQLRVLILLLFVLLIPFENLNFSLRGILSITKVLGFVLALLSMVRIHQWAPHPPLAFWCFAAYFLVFAMLAPFEAYDGWVYKSAIQAATFLQMLVFLLIAIDLLRDEQVRKSMLWMNFLGCFVLGMLQCLGLTAADIVDSDTGRVIEGRESAFGGDPNSLAGLLSIGLFCLLGLAYARRDANRVAKWLVLPSLAVIGIPIVRTGSRSGLLALVMGLLVLIGKGRDVRHKARNILIVGIALVFLAVLTLQSEYASTRWQKTFETGTLAGREKITPMAFELFLERPILGWGPVGHAYELGSRLGQTIGNRQRGAHNLILTILLETGLAGGLPYVIGLALCLRAAWHARTGPEGLLPLMLMTALLIYNMADTWHNQKTFWLILAYVLSQEPRFRDRRLRF